jgi:hypothetical protein
VFNGLNKDDDRQTVTFSQKDGSTILFEDREQLLCRLAPNKTNLTIEDFKAFDGIGILGQLVEKWMTEKLEFINGDPFAVCQVSNSDQVRYFSYKKDDDAYKYMVKFTNKKFHVNDTLYSLSCHQKTTHRTAKQVLEQSVKDRLKLEAGENGYEKYKYHLGLTLLVRIIVVTLSLCCCTTNNDIPDNEYPNNQYPASSDLVLDVLDTDESLSTVEENTQSNSVELEENAESQSNSAEPDADTQSQTKSVELNENIQPQSNSVELKEDTQPQTTSLVLEDAQSQSDTLEKENTQSETDSLLN